MAINALYIHLPFCRQKCNYCSFISYQDKEAEIPAYIAAIIEELFKRLETDQLNTIYFGGGTPSLIPWEMLGQIMDTIWSLTAMDPAAEITIEANPGTVDEPYLQALKKIGINRISFGAQSFNDNELAILGRIHTKTKISEAVRFARTAGFTNINLDLIYGIPRQTLESWETTLINAKALSPEHISLYSLTLDEQVPMIKLIESGELPPLNPDLCADQYELAEDMLTKYGYSHYEISNWAKSGFECSHNLVYWNMLPYLGIGIAAHSYLDNHRLANTNSLEEYIKAITEDQDLAISMDEEIKPELQTSESIILGLRLIDGISLDDINTRFGIDVKEKYKQQINDLQSAELLEFEGGMMRLTRRGRLLGNEVFHRFLPD